MSWLLDVNALLALAHQQHADHHRMIQWYAERMATGAKLATCSITEIGFVRVSIQAGFERDAAGAVETLEGLKESSRLPFLLLADESGARHLPGWVSGPKQVTDGHLVELAKAHGMRLATLDKGIPGADRIP